LSTCIVLKYQRFYFLILNMTSYGETLYVDQLFVDGKEVKGTPGGFQTLEETLTAGDDANGLDINNVGTLTTQAAGPGVLAKQSDIKADVIETRFVNSSFCNTIELRANDLQAIAPAVLDITCQNLTSTGTISYTTFDPPLSSVGTPSLAATMTVDNSVGLNALNMNNQDIQNANNISVNSTVACTTLQCNQGQVLAAPIVGGDASLNITNSDASTTAKIDFTGVAGSTQDTFIEGDSSITGGNPKLTRCTYLDLTDPTNSFPSVVAGDLAATLALGNNAGSTGIDMNNQAISNALSVGATAIQAVQASITSLGSPAITVNGTTAPFSGLLNMNASTGGTSKIDFTGATNAPQDTFLEGDNRLVSGAPVRTKCTYLDLTDSTNLFTPNDNEIYEWGGVWLNPRAQKFGGGTNPYVYIASYEDRFPGWRLFQAMSNGTPDFSEPRYQYAADNKPFYVKTAPTTIPAHSTQIVELTFPVWYEGYGRIYMGLYYSLDNDAATKVFLPNSGRLFEPRHGAGGVRDNRVTGYKTMQWVVSGFPTDGTVWRIFPCLRTDDSYELGALEIIIGNGTPESSSLTGVQHGQLIMRGYPRPASWYEFEGIA
jgi:hypothetical protein